ncbi:helix-turn-helix domain-containing protein [Candidatus Nitrosocosmicus hydrocola]|uniref:helix-turn-helix domain-containing protein n=1 Tax=Candidatus Nitrosocosmicus hydrocola TaxID=1826872 RepID=UPI0011E5AF5A|nr:helix-turn-helix domain-containing protein [Candidatus Nitrosocosmicus hydrocola]
MTCKLPPQIKIKVLKLWLEGNSRNKIARILDIGAGSVSGIIQNTRLTMNDIDLLRAVAEDLNREEVDIYTFASAINLKRKMEESEWPQELIEKFIEDMYIISFKTEIKPKILLEKFVSILVLTINLNLPIDQANYSVDVLNKRLEDLEITLTNKKNHVNRLQQTLFATIEEATDFAQHRDWKLEREQLLNHLEELEKENSILGLEIMILKAQGKENVYSYPRLNLTSQFVDKDSSEKIAH